MKKLLFLLFFLPLISFSQINQYNKNGERHGEWKTYYENGTPIQITPKLLDLLKKIGEREEID